MNPELQAALVAARDSRAEIERQLGPRHELAPYDLPTPPEEQQLQALAEMEALKKALRVYLFRPGPDITVVELAAVVALALPQVSVNPAGQTLEGRLGPAARHFVLKS